GGLLRSAAHLTLDAGTAGSLELHLRVRDGALHLRVEGEGARALEAHSGELSRALAGEGLKLAPIELGGADAGPRSSGEGGRGFEERRDAWQEAADARHQPGAPPPPAPHGAAAPQGGRGIHVEA
ncbi:MAG TPA: flagellar hook-length control protein FliK, partial [Anaeromyxobacteraceae bacterium]